MTREADTDVAAERYRALVEHLGDEMGRRHGWISVTARKLGVHRSTLLKITTGERRPTASLMERAAEQLQLPMGWFTDPEAFPGPPGEYMGRAAGASPSGPSGPDREAWLMIARRAAELALCPEEGDALRPKLEALVVALEHVPLFPAYLAASLALERKSNEGLRAVARSLALNTRKALHAAASHAPDARDEVEATIARR